MLSTIHPSSRELDLRGAFEAWLDRIVRNDSTHARFANTLSLLEHIGSVKIARTQSRPQIDADILQHLAEEARHADLLKRLVGRIGGDALPDYTDEHLLAGPAARGYFARLDATVRRFVRTHCGAATADAAAYNLVTWLVERRAMWLYPVYQDALEQSGSRLSVRSIIGEETRHLEDVMSALERIGLADATLVEPLVRDEELLFARLASELFAATAEHAIEGSTVTAEA